MYCPEVSFFFQFSAFMMLMCSVLLACGAAWYHQHAFKKRDNRMRRGRRR